MTHNDLAKKIKIIDLDKPKPKSPYGRTSILGSPGDYEADSVGVGGKPLMLPLTLPMYPKIDVDQFTKELIVPKQMIDWDQAYERDWKKPVKFPIEREAIKVTVYLTPEEWEDCKDVGSHQRMFARVLKEQFDYNDKFTVLNPFMHMTNRVRFTVRLDTTRCLVQLNYIDGWSECCRLWSGHTGHHVSHHINKEWIGVPVGKHCRLHHDTLRGEYEQKTLGPADDARCPDCGDTL